VCVCLCVCVCARVRAAECWRPLAVAGTPHGHALLTPCPCVAHALLTRDCLSASWMLLSRRRVSHTHASGGSTPHNALALHTHPGGAGVHQALAGRWPGGST
jgi:hypothetical protein